jgi:hypothetical protein
LGHGFVEVFTMRRDASFSFLAGVSMTTTHETIFMGQWPPTDLFGIDDARILHKQHLNQEHSSIRLRFPIHALAYRGEHHHERSKTRVDNSGIPPTLQELVCFGRWSHWRAPQYGRVGIHGRKRVDEYWLGAPI